MVMRWFLDEVSKRLGKRSLVWLGIRGSDAQPLLRIPQFSRAFSITNPLDPPPAVREVCLETMLKRRLNLHLYDLGQDNSEEAERMHSLLFAAFRRPAAVLTYEPDKFLATAYLPQAASVSYLGLFHEQQAIFKNKSWVESELRKCGVRTLPWSYYGQHKKPDIVRLLKKGPLVVRSGESGLSRGGAGISIVREPDQIDLSQYGHDALYAVSRFLEPNISLNINACLFQDRTISLHGPSVQLIGLSSCTGLKLGYCGNDFAQIRNLDVNILDELETMTLQAGKWLAGMGYLGSFGLDAIVYRNQVYFTEINPRFQGSVLVSAQIDEELGRPDIFLNHMAAFFGMSAPPHVPLSRLAKQQREISQIFCYNRNPQSVFYRTASTGRTDGMDFLQLPARDVAVEPEGILFRAVVEDRVTTSGHSLLKKYADRISGMTQRFSPGTTSRSPAKTESY